VLAAGYFVNTVFTTVGFGDVHGTNSAERLFIIVAMWTGALVFSTTISSMQVAYIRGLVSRGRGLVSCDVQGRAGRLVFSSRLLVSSSLRLLYVSTSSLRLLYVFCRSVRLL
jgi:hypothetical protein